MSSLRVAATKRVTYDGVAYHPGDVFTLRDPADFKRCCMRWLEC